MFCSKCGKEIPDESKFCGSCGADLTGKVVVKNQNQNQTTFSENNIPEEYRPISMWGYFGWEILFSIPCVGLILLIVFAFGGTRNKNLRNFASSYFCVLILAIIIFFVVMIFSASVGIMTSAIR